MASSDRARYHLEQSISELQELLSKDLFNVEETSAIARKRSDFEHTINARGCKPGDYVRYLAYEQTLYQLRGKRMRRQGVRNLVYGGHRRLFALFERATHQFRGDLRLWILYLRYTRAVKAYKRIGKILITLLRLQPSNANVWILAARHSAYIQDDLNTARGYIQRGLRFTPKHKGLWLEHAGIEMAFVQKATAQFERLGVGRSAGGEESTYFDEQALRQMSNTPAFSGSIVRAVFEAAMASFSDDSAFVEDFFDRVAQNAKLGCCRPILSEITEYLKIHHPKSPHTASCSFKLPLIGLDTASPEFYSGLEVSLASMQAVLTDESRKLEVAQKLSIVMSRLISKHDIEPETLQVLQTSLNYVLQLVVSNGKPHHSSLSFTKLKLT